MLPILERLLYKAAADRVTRVLVLVPTRELGAQVDVCFSFNDTFIVVEILIEIYIIISLLWCRRENTGFFS